MNPCGNRTRHTTRIGCCSGCKRLFSSDTAFERHRVALACADPVERGLVPVPSKEFPEETIWSLPGSRPQHLREASGAGHTQAFGPEAGTGTPPVLSPPRTP